MSNARRAHPTLSLLVFVAFLLLPACGGREAADTGSPTTDADAPVDGLEGVRPHAVRETEAGRCFVYPAYVVHASERSSAAGQDVIVMRRPGQTAADTACDQRADTVFATAGDDARHFLGVSGHTLLLEDGTGPLRGLVVFDLANGTTMYEGSYGEPLGFSDGRLTFFEPLLARPDTAVACPEAEEWRAAGFSVGYEHQVHLDLATGDRTATGTVRCAPQQ